MMRPPYCDLMKIKNNARNRLNGLKSTKKPKRSTARPRRTERIIFQNIDEFSIEFSPEEEGMLVGGVPSDDVSVPTVDSSFSDDTFSVMTEQSFIASHEKHIPLPYIAEGCSESDDLSDSSIATIALNQIKELKLRLRTQENTKLELLNQCLQLESRIEKNESTVATAQRYKTENRELSEKCTKMEHEYMNAMNDMVTKMAIMETDFHEKLQWREAKIKSLEQELVELKESKNLDTATTVDTFSIKLSSSEDSSSKGYNYEYKYDSLGGVERDDHQPMFTRNLKQEKREAPTIPHEVSFVPKIMVPHTTDDRGDGDSSDILSVNLSVLSDSY